MRFLIPAVSLALAAQAAPALAQQAASPEATDERCILAMIALSNSTDQTASRMGQSGVFFFAGRLKGRDPNFDFNKLKAVSATMNADSAKTDLQQRCGPLVSTAIQQLQGALTPPGSQAPSAAKPATPAPQAPRPNPTPPPKR